MAHLGVLEKEIWKLLFKVSGLGFKGPRSPHNRALGPKYQTGIWALEVQLFRSKYYTITCIWALEVQLFRSQYYTITGIWALGSPTIQVLWTLKACDFCVCGESMARVDFLYKNKSLNPKS